MTADQNLALDRQMCFSLYRASRLVTRAYQDLLAELNLTYTQYLVMLVLWETEEISMKELAGKLDLDSGTLTPLVKRLVALNLATKARDPRDERRAVLTLTPTGRELQEKARTIPGEVHSLCAVQDLDLPQLKAELDKLSDRLAG